MHVSCIFIAFFFVLLQNPLLRVQQRSKLLNNIQQTHRVGIIHDCDSSPFSLLGAQGYNMLSLQVWDIPCIARVMVRITLPGGVSNVSQRAGWNNFQPRVAKPRVPYLLDVLCRQPIKPFQVVSTSEFHEY